MKCYEYLCTSFCVQIYIYVYIFFHLHIYIYIYICIYISLSSVKCMFKRNYLLLSRVVISFYSLISNI